MSSAFDHSKVALARATMGNAEAADFLLSWRKYVHEIDDIIDGERQDPDQILSTFASAAMLYSHPFYLKNLQALRQLVLNCTNAYADSVLWEKANDQWKRDFSDHYRHFGAEMVLAVAGICGGYDHMRAISLELRSICYHEHHDAEGKAV